MDKLTPSLEWSCWDWSFDQVWCPFGITELKKNSQEFIAYGLHALKLETFIWILAITINLHMIFWVVFLWLKFETHPSFLHNLKMANKLNYPLFCIKGGMRLVNAEHTRTMSSSKSFIFKGITELKILNRLTLSIALSTWIRALAIAWPFWTFCLVNWLCPFVKGGHVEFDLFHKEEVLDIKPSVNHTGCVLLKLRNDSAIFKYVPIWG